VNLKCIIPVIVLLLVSGSLYAQDSLLVAPAGNMVIEEPVDYEPYDALAPARAAFYSAVLPGLGQAHNGKYWKIPIAYAGLGVGVYFYLNNDEQYERYDRSTKDGSQDLPMMNLLLPREFKELPMTV
jgi:hypothetical protein